jgi:hypothetical protein
VPRAPVTQSRSHAGLIPDADRVGILAEWLMAHDKAFWTADVSPKDAILQSPLPTKESELRELAGEYCVFWLEKKAAHPRREAVDATLTWEQWDRINFLCTKHAGILNGPDSTFEFCLKFLLVAKAKINKTLLMNCSAFHRITQRRFISK